MKNNGQHLTEIDRRQSLLGLAGLAALSAIPGNANALGSTAFFNRRIHDEAHQKIAELAGNRISNIAFTPSDGWVITTLDGPFFARGIPDECYEKLGEFVRAGHQINCVAFPPTRGNRWVICADNAFFARGIPEECYQKMGELRNKGHKIKHVAFPRPAGNRWVIITDKDFLVKNIDDECFQSMQNLAQHGRMITKVEFSKQNRGFVVLAEDYFYGKRVDPECLVRLNELRKDGKEIHALAFRRKNNGWSISSHGEFKTRAPAKARQFERAFSYKQGLEAEEITTNIWSRMDDLKVPGCTVAAIVDNKIDWMGGYGVLEKDRPGAAHPDSRFQAASISKPVAAMGVLHLIENSSDLSLDQDIREVLEWELTARNCLSVTNAPTIKSILKHKGGIIGRGSTYPLGKCSGFDEKKGGGFGGYLASNNALPTLLEILNGAGDLPKIELSTNPGTKHYSGHGYLVLQRLIEEQSGVSFEKYMQDNILDPLGLKNSRFTTQVPEAWISRNQVAAGHRARGDHIRGKRNQYPEAAAAGLYSSTEDLAKLIIWINKRYADEINSGPLSKASVEDLTSGLGFRSGSRDGVPWYAHGGVNKGFRCFMGGYPERGAGYVVMTNGASDKFRLEARNAMKSVYDWG